MIPVDILSTPQSDFVITTRRYLILNILSLPYSFLIHDKLSFALLLLNPLGDRRKRNFNHTQATVIIILPNLSVVLQINKWQSKMQHVLDFLILNFTFFGFIIIQATLNEFLKSLWIFNIS